MSANGIRALPTTLRQIAFGAIGAGFTPIGAPFDNAIRIISLKNFTNATLYFSYNGVDEQEILLPNSAIVIDFSTNSSYAEFPMISKSTTIYVAYAVGAPTSGLAAVSAYYCLGD